MKIQQIYVDNFLGVQSVALETARAVQVIAGANGAGKSSLRDAVALALTGDLGRVSLKKEVHQLIHAGADTAVCGITTADGDEHTTTISSNGKMTTGKLPDIPALLYVLDAQRFARLKLDERRSFLFGLMGVKMDGPAIKARLLNKQCNPAKVDRVAPMLRSGFEAACADAKAKATETKGAWKAITHEVYGAVKAETWEAVIPEHNAAEAKALGTELQHLDISLDKWLQEVGKTKAEGQRRAGLQAKLPGLKEKAGLIERLQKKLETDGQQLADWEADLTKAQAAAGETPRVGLVHDLAKALSQALFFVDDGHEFADTMKAPLAAYETEYGSLATGATAVDAKAKARIPAIIASRDLMNKAVANSKRDLEAAQQAQSEVTTIEADLAQEFDDKGQAAAQQQVDELKAKRAELVKKQDAFSSLKKQAEAAEQRTKDARAHHDDVTQWDQIADALSPSGIPGDILAEALGPINDRLDQSAADTNWPRVVIDADMTITGGGRDYRLLSESEQWRVDAMVAEAVANLSGTCLLVLDRFDVLDLAARSQLLNWLDVLADLGELHTALVFGTLKALPANLPETIDAHWIDGGVVAQLKEAA